MLLLPPISGLAFHCCPRVQQSSPRAKGPRAGLLPPRAAISMPDRKWGVAISHWSGTDFNLMMSPGFLLLPVSPPKRIKRKNNNSQPGVKRACFEVGISMLNWDKRAMKGWVNARLGASRIRGPLRLQSARPRKSNPKSTVLIARRSFY